PLLEQPDETAEPNMDEKAPGEASMEAENTEPPPPDSAPVADKAEEVKVDGDSQPGEIDWEAYLNSYQFNEQTTPSNKGNVATDECTLRHIQHLEPKGCGARDLQECLLIQVAALKDPAAPLLGTIIKKHMKHLESKNLPAIAKELKTTLEEIIKAVKLVPKLD